VEKMEDEFTLRIVSGPKREDNKKRTHTIDAPSNPALKNLTLQLPVSYEGPSGDYGERYYTPEHYYLAAISGCFFTTFSVVSSNSKLDYNTLTIESKGTVGNTTGVKMMEKIEQTIILTVPSNVSEKKARKVLELTESACPLVKSIKTEVINTYKIIAQ
jgi:uncharacterized OsmC-like protein